MNIIVTGGAGFLGSHLVERLLKDGHFVTVLDDFSMGKIENLPTSKNSLIVVAGSILDDNSTLYEDTDVVFHLAALTRPRESLVFPIETNQVNIEGTLKTLMHAKEHKIKKFIFVSSASTYGYQNKFPFNESAPLLPVSPYALTKVVGEKYCDLFRRLYGMNINAVRPFNIYGKRQDPSGPYGSAVPKFIDLLKKDKQPYITGGGEQFRDFVYVEDVVDLMVKLMESDLDGRVVNAGSGVKTTINELYETICGLMKKEVKPNHVLPEFDPDTTADITNAYNLLSWKPKYSLVEGLLKTI